MHLRSRSLFAAALSVFLAACGGGGGDGPTGTGGGDAVASVVLGPDAATLTAIGADVQLTATAHDAHGGPVAGAAIAWRSLEPEIATVVTGRVTAVAPGSARIVAQVGTKADTAVVTVAPAVARLELAQSAFSFDALGQCGSLTVTPLDANGHAVSVTPAFATRAAQVVSVDEAGGITAVGNGATYVVASVGDVRDSVPVSVHQVAARLTVPGTMTFASINEAHSVDYHVLDANGHDVAGVPVVVASADQSIARFGDDSLLRAIGNGETTITVTADGRLNGSFTARVQQVVASLVPSADSVLITAIGADQSVVVTPRDANTFIVSGVTLTQAIADASIASTSAFGDFQAVAAGRTTVTFAAPNGVSTTIPIVVHQVPSSMTAPGSITLTEFTSATITIHVYDANGHEIASPGCSFVSQDESTASVDASGGVVGVNAGTTTITITCGTLQKTVSVTVKAAVT